VSIHCKLHFLGLGPQRTVSSWLDQVLRAHPGASLPRQVKETFFFDERFDRGWDWYRSHFREDGISQKIGEIAPTCFDSPEARSRVAEYFPTLRLIINVRNPIARAHSLFRHHRTKGRVPDDFDAAVKVMPRIITSGKYAEHASAWEKVFGPQQILYLVQEDIQADPEEIFHTVCDFLDLEKVPLPAIGRNPYGEGTSPRFPRLARSAAAMATWARDKRLHGPIEFAKMLGLKAVFRGGEPAAPLNEDQFRFLLDFYTADIEWLEKHLNRDLSNWKSVVPVAK